MYGRSPHRKVFSLGLISASRTPTVHPVARKQKPVGNSNVISIRLPLPVLDWVRAEAFDKGMGPSTFLSAKLERLYVGKLARDRVSSDQ